jgi:TldD protein
MTMTDPDVLEVMRSVLAAGRGDNRYLDVRFVRRRSETIAVRNGVCWQADGGESTGLGVRVRTAHGWGFAATSQLTLAAGLQALARALLMSAPAATAFPLAPVSPQQGSYTSPVAVDPFALDFAAKLDHLLAAEAMMRIDARVAVTAATYGARQDDVTLLTTDGTSIEQRITSCGAAISSTAVDRGEVQHRSYPCPGGEWAQRGFEHVSGLELGAHAPRVGQESVELLTAPICPSGPHTVIIGGHQMALQVHESVGHATELDRILGVEAAYAGTSFVRASDIGTLRYGSPLMNVTADATMPGGLGTYAWDDEGVSARPVALVQDGMLAGFSSSRETAAAVAAGSSTGAMRGDGWSRQPLVRMTNVNLKPGAAGSLDELLSDTGDGVYLETNRSGSIDDKRLNFHFATEVAREIKHGRWGRLYRDPGYRGITPSFWAGLDAVCGPSEWHSWGTTNCGKGEPAQLMMVSHATVPARFRGIDLVPTR